MNILVVDDLFQDSERQKLIKLGNQFEAKCLDKNTFSYVGKEYIYEALDHLQKNQNWFETDIIIVDEMLSGTEKGQDLIKKVSEEYPFIYSVLLTAFGNTDIIARVAYNTNFKYIDKSELSDNSKTNDHIEEILNSKHFKEIQDKKSKIRNQLSTCEVFLELLEVICEIEIADTLIHDKYVGKQLDKLEIILQKEFGLAGFNMSSVSSGSYTLSAICEPIRTIKSNSSSYREKIGIGVGEKGQANRIKTFVVNNLESMIILLSKMENKEKWKKVRNKLLPSLKDKNKKYIILDHPYYNVI